MEKTWPISPEEILKMDSPFFEIQAWWGSTKHLGGRKATDELLKLCHISGKGTLLDVGCGVGSTACYAVRKYNCRAVGVDISSRMVERAKERAKREGVETAVEFEVANVLNLPYPDNTFDVVIAESVLTFVKKKKEAIKEMVRVTKPSGYVGINEAYWVGRPAPEAVLTYFSQSLGDEAELLQPDEWTNYLESEGLQDIIIEENRFRSGLHEYMEILRQTGAKNIPPALARFCYAYLRYSSFRKYISELFRSIPTAFFESIGYGIYVGKKERSRF